MNNKEYIKLAIKTEAPLPECLNSLPPQTIRLLHGAIGLSTESGELLDALKKVLFYDKVLDIVNIKEEIGDILWYISVICDAAKIDINDCMETNIKKLKTRYPEKFSSDKALNRNLAAERKILEGNK